jgi:hypothetical protein
MLRNRLWKALEIAGRAAANLPGPDGRMPSGHNGPYDDKMTPVRNTAHWVCLFGALAEETGNPAFQRAAHKCADYLCSEDAQSSGLLRNRMARAKDPWNGLIGQVWALEALLFAGTRMSRTDCMRLFHEVLIHLPFDESVCLWRLSPLGDRSRLVLTLNQQIWMASLIARAAEVVNADQLKSVELFLSEVAHYVRLRQNGVLRQVISFRSKECVSLPRLALVDPRNVLLGHHLQAVCRRLRWGALADLGYHAFTLFGLAQIKLAFPMHPFWSDAQLRMSLDTCAREEFYQQNVTNPFGGGYHLVGIETALSLCLFQWGRSDARTERIRRCTEQDLAHLSGSGQLRHAIHITDTETVTARLYECVALARALDDITI